MIAESIEAEAEWGEEENTEAKGEKDMDIKEQKKSEDKRDH